MPQARHYDNILLDNCYLYTFDEKYKQTVMQELGRNAYDTKVIFLKNEYKNFSLKKGMFDSDFDGFDERQTFNILHQYYIDKYKLTTHKKNNKTILEANGYNFKNTIENFIVKDKIVRINSVEFDNDRTRLMLERIFLKNKLFTKKFVDLTIPEFYAFVINNEDVIKHDFQEAVSQKARQIAMNLEEVKEIDWK